MFKYIIMQWKHKKIILCLIIIGFFVGSLFLSIGASMVKENYNYIMDQNSGDYSKQLEVELTIQEGLEKTEISNIFEQLGTYGEIQIVSLDGVQIDNKICQIVPTVSKNQGDWHIPLIEGEYLEGKSGQIILGKSVSNKMKAEIGSSVKIGEKSYIVKGICGRKNRETIWDDTIYMEFEDYFLTNPNEFYNETKVNKYFVVLKNGKEEFMNEFDDVEKSLNAKGVEIVYQEMEKVVDDSSLNNSIVITVAASLLVFLIAIINIINLMVYWMMERKKEIGIMKAIGASNPFIIKWVIIEMTMLSVIGAILALMSQFVINMIFDSLLIKYHVSIDLSFINLLLAIIVSSLCGIISALLIVRKSVMFNPIEVISCE